MKRVLFVLLALGIANTGTVEALAGSSAAPDGSPSGDEVRRVLGYYFAEDSSAPLLIETRLCSDIATEGESKNECTGELDPDTILADTDTYLWLNFLVPKQAKDPKVLIQFNHDGLTRQAREVSLSSGIRFRTWKRFKLDRPGRWTIDVLHDAADGARKLERIDLRVGSPPVADAAR
ncbi:MAG: hypothetical protein JRG82_05590 [Deltaproteobacteria bacterium]|nr:hypothetical protein [Deltaproteobacteria bacterium]